MFGFSGSFIFSITFSITNGCASGSVISISVKCNLAYDSKDPSVALCTQYKFKSSPITLEETLLHVVGADGLEPRFIDLIGVHVNDDPLSLLEPTLK